MHLEFTIPSRGIIGLNNAVLTASAGEAIMAHRFLEYQPWKGEIERRTNGSIIAMETGTAYAYALNNLMIKCLWLLLRCSAWKMLWNISKAMNM